MNLILGYDKIKSRDCKRLHTIVLNLNKGLYDEHSLYIIKIGTGGNTSQACNIQRRNGNDF